MREFLIRLFDALNGQEHRPSSPTASLERSIAAMTSDINASDRLRNVLQPRSHWPAAKSTPSGADCRSWTADAGLPELATP
jgi:hypothetical protein